MKVTAVILLSLIYLQCNSSNPNVDDKGLNHGTVILAAIGKDGIILVSDSRIGISTDNSMYVHGYYDRQQKVYSLKKYAIGVYGVQSFRCDYTRKVINDFLALRPTYNTPAELNQQFVQHIKTKYPADAESIFRISCYISIGYVNQEPKISAIMHSRIIENKDWIWTPGGPKDMDPNGFFDYSRSYTCDQLAKNAQKAIAEFVKHEPAEAKKRIGGPISIIKIDKNNKVTFLKNNFTSTTYLDHCHFMKDYQSGKVKITYPTKADSLIIKNYYNKITPFCCGSQRF